MPVLNQKIIEETKIVMKENFVIMVAYFLEDVAADIAAIQDRVHNKNAEKIILSSHTIKSSSKLVGAENLSVVAMKIEELAREMSTGKEADSKELVLLLGQLRKAFSDAEPELKALISE